MGIEMYEFSKRFEKRENGTHEIRHRLLHEFFECPGCTAMLDAEQETECWTWDDKRKRWIHDEYGPETAFCETCNIAVIGGYDSDYVLFLGDDRE